MAGLKPQGPASSEAEQGLLDASRSGSALSEREHVEATDAPRSMLATLLHDDATETKLAEDRSS